MIDFICSDCLQKVPAGQAGYRCNCGGLWQLEAAGLTNIIESFSLDRIQRSNPGLARYAPFLPLPAETLISLSRQESQTPLLQLTPDLCVKNESALPHGSFKDRGAWAVIAFAVQKGAASIVQDSSGNAGFSVAAYAAQAGLPCEIYVPENTNPGKIAKIEAVGATVHVIPGSRDHCADVLRARLDSNDTIANSNHPHPFYASHVYQPLFIQGVKTIIYELFEQRRKMPQHIFLPVGNGTLLLGLIRGLEDLRAVGLLARFPKLIAVQSANCAPLATAWERKENSPCPISAKPTLAEGIAIARPARGREILALTGKYHIIWQQVSDDAIEQAGQKLRHYGLAAEPTAAAAFAAYSKFCSLHGTPPDTLIPVTGNNFEII